MSLSQTSYPFALAALLPALCIVLASVFGGPLIWLALASMTVIVAGMDRLAHGPEPQKKDARWLPFSVGFAHFAALGATLWAVGTTGLHSSPEKVLLVITMGLYAGQVSNACAHELIHRSTRNARRLGTAMYCSILNGQHVSAHLLVHHIHAGTPQDPTSAPLGRGFYRFALTAGVAEFRAGWRAETRRRITNPSGLHPYCIYIAGAAIALLSAALMGGSWAVLALMALSLHAQMQLLLSDYVQHYGLTRAKKPDGSASPMGPEHSWNAPHPYSAALLMNAPHHSDHHMHPKRAFPDLELRAETMPVLPHSLPVMGTIALLPPLWRAIMDKRVQQWTPPQNFDQTPSLPPSQSR